MKPIVPSKIAEIIFALMIAYFGFNYFKDPVRMAGSVPGFMPGDAKIWIYVVGACFVLAAIAIIIDFQKTLACYFLAALLLFLVFTIHLKNFGRDPAGVVKDTAMAMAAIIIGNRGAK